MSIQRWRQTQFGRVEDDNGPLVMYESHLADKEQAIRSLKDAANSHKQARKAAEEAHSRDVELAAERIKDLETQLYRARAACEDAKALFESPTPPTDEQRELIIEELGYAVSNRPAGGEEEQ